MSVEDVKDCRCITESMKCRYFVPVKSISSDLQEVTVFGCNSELETCGGCCREMEEYSSNIEDSDDYGTIEFTDRLKEKFRKELINRNINWKTMKVCSGINCAVDGRLYAFVKKNKKGEVNVYDLSEDD